MRKTKQLISYIIIITFLFCGCADKREVDDQVYTLVIGIDKGVNNKIRLTVQFPVYQEGKGGGMSGGGTSQQKPDAITSTVEAPSILEGLDLLGTSTSRRISLVHSKLIVISEDFARSGVGEFLQPIARYRETRRIMQVVICKGTAEAFINENTTLIGQSLSKAMELKQKQSDYTGFFPRTTFLNFYRGTLSPYSQPYAAYAGINHFANLQSQPQKEKPPLVTGQGFLPGEVPKVGDLKNEFVGTAVFNGDKMIGTLTSYETRYFLMVTGEFKRGIMTVAEEISPNKGVVVDLRPGRRPKVTARFEKGRPIIDVSLYIEADLASVQSRYPYEEADKIKELNSLIEKQINKGMEKLVKKCKYDLKSDIFGFGYKVAYNFSTMQEFQSYHWLNHFSDSEVNIHTKVNVRRTGIMMKSSPIQYNEAAEEQLEEKE